MTEPSKAAATTPLSIGGDDADAALRIDDLTVDYLPRRDSGRLQALAGLSLELAPGSVTALIGESGSGKSTLARLLGSLRPKEAFAIVGGSATVLGTELRRARAKALDRLRVRVGYLAQDAGSRLTAQLTVAENVAEPILRRDRKWDPRDLELRVATLLDRVKLPLAMLDRLPYELSSGMRQRVALARSLVLEPSVWIADEPSRGVDVTLDDLVPELIAQEQAAREFTSLVVSHELAFREGFTDRIAVLSAGALIGIGRPDELLRDPLHPYLIALRRERESAAG